MDKAITKKSEVKLVLPVRDLATDKVNSREAPEWMRTRAADSLLAQAVHVERRRERILRAHTKGRSEVRGGGAKPWKQKGTGRARHGSRRSPIWVGGGITFGPRSIKSRLPRLNGAMSKLALAGMLSDRLKAGRLEAVKLDGVKLEKSRETRKVLGKKHGVLLVVADDRAVMARAGRNVPGIKVKVVSRVTICDIAEARMIKIDEKCLEVLGKRI